MTLPHQSVNRPTTNTTNEGYVMSDFRLLINGRLAQGAGALDVINPATGGTLTAAPRADRGGNEALRLGQGRDDPPGPREWALGDELREPRGRPEEDEVASGFSTLGSPDSL